jgi:Glycosyl transferase family 2
MMAASRGAVRQARTRGRSPSDPSDVACAAGPERGTAVKSPRNTAADGMELSVVLPCLNEAETIAICVQKALSFLAIHGIDGEVLVADNGSTDGSQALALTAGARLVQVPEQGYGSALMGGIAAARGRYVIMGDADDSYDLTALMPFVERLRAGADLVMGNRFKGGIAPGAMPRLHRYLGNPVLSFIGRLFFRSKIGDFHCGIRGFNRERILRLGLQATGMEFASEIVVKATLDGYRVDEVPTTLVKDGRSRPPHLRSWRDGWRHLRFLLLFSPRWLFLYPGFAMIATGAAIGIALASGPLEIDGVRLDMGTLVSAAALLIIGVQSVLFGVLTHVYASNEGFLPYNAMVARLLKWWTLERVLAVGAALGLAGLAGIAAAFVRRLGSVGDQANFNFLLRIVLSSATALVVSCQVMLGAFFLSILGIRRSGHEPGQAPHLAQDYLPHEPHSAAGVAHPAPSTVGAVGD